MNSDGYEDDNDEHGKGDLVMMMMMRVMTTRKDGKIGNGFTKGFPGTWSHVAGVHSWYLRTTLYYCRTSFYVHLYKFYANIVQISTKYDPLPTHENIFGYREQPLLLHENILCTFYVHSMYT